MTGQNWFFALGWRHLVAIGAIIFALIPIRSSRRRRSTRWAR